MSKDQKEKLQIISYPDYKKFQNILTDKTYPIKDFINPITFFIPSKEKAFSFDSQSFLQTIFNLRSFRLPYFNIVDKEIEKYSRFDDFTKRDEVNNIALWILSALDYCSISKLKLGKELEINQEDNPRDGRLDVVAIRNSESLVIETKTDIKTLLNENHFTSQITSYNQECLKYMKEYLSSENLLILLAVGGEETDMYPLGHPDCTTGSVGNISKIFYDKIIASNIKFVSANALWSLVAYKYITNNNLDIFNILKKIFSDKQAIGFLTGGIVKNTKNGIIIEKFDLNTFKFIYSDSSLPVQ